MKERRQCMFNDDELIEKIRHGDEQAAEELIKR